MISRIPSCSPRIFPNRNLRRLSISERTNKIRPVAELGHPNRQASGAMPQRAELTLRCCDNANEPTFRWTLRRRSSHEKSIWPR